MNPDQTLDVEARARIRVLVDTYRVRCLWSFRSDFYPETVGEAQRVLDAIERHGDREAFIRSAETKAWLSPDSNAPSAAS